MRLLDLFCGAGGAAMGYHRAGFEVVGVDINPQPHYPFEFHQGDAMTWPLDGFDVIHASPPCQAYSSLQRLGKQAHKTHPDLLALVRDRLMASGIPYVIENVPEAPLRDPLKLCGSSFGLAVRRHRLFESSVLLLGTPCLHTKVQPIAVYGDHPQGPKGDGHRKLNRARSLAEGQKAMGIDWMPWKQLTQAIPPAYTEYIGRQLIHG